MISVHKTIASALGIGYIGKGSGTAASAACCLLWYFLNDLNQFKTAMLPVLAITFIGVWSSAKMESIWGHDSHRVVIDEVSGMSLSLIGIPLNWKYFFVAFLLFRFFDIYKPFFIKRLENLPGGWGVMLDDVLAGIYTNVIMQFLLYSKFLS